MSEPLPVFPSSEGVAIRDINKNGHNYLHFTFNGKFSTEWSNKATLEWKKYCQNNSSKKFIHIWDCQNMNGFDKEAKNIWMKQMDEFNNQTERIILISDNIIIRGAARLMSKFTKHTLSTYKNLTDMSEQEFELTL